MGTVSKTVRLPEELVEFVEALPGDNFTVKLVGLLENLISGKDKRLHELEYLDERIRNKRQQLDTYWKVVEAAHQVEVIYERMIKEIFAQVDSKE